MRLLTSMPVSVWQRHQKIYDRAIDQGVTDDFPTGAMGLLTLLIDLSARGYVERRESREKFNGGKPFSRFRTTPAMMERARAELTDIVPEKVVKATLATQRPIVPCAVCGTVRKTFVIWYGKGRQHSLPACSSTCREMLRQRLAKDGEIEVEQVSTS